MKNCRYLCVALLASVVTVAHAGEAVGTVEFVQAGQGFTPDNAYVLIQISGQRNGAPICASDPRMAINPATVHGKAMLALLLSAHASGKQVRLYGTGNCNVMGNEFESISFMRLLQ